MAPADALPAMMIHMTNTHILPYMVWNDENLDLEWKFGPEPQQSKFSYDFLRAETLGRQTGNVPWALDRIMDAKSKEQEAMAVRTRFGTMMVHEIRWWGMGEDEEGRCSRLIRFRLCAGRLPGIQLLAAGLPGQIQRCGRKDFVAQEGQRL